MTEISRPWSGTVTGDAGPYTFDDWDDLFRAFLAQDRAIDGVFSNQLDELRYSGASTPAIVERGRALVDGTWYESDVDISTVVASPAANPRIDRYVLRKNWAAQTVRLTVITGAEGASPVAPTITQTPGVDWDLPLFQIHITTGGVITLYRDERNFIGNYQVQGLRDNIFYYEDEFDYRTDGTIVVGDRFGRWAYRLDSNGSLTIVSGTGFIGALRFSSDGGGNANQKIEANSVVGPLTHRLRWECRVNQVNSNANGLIRIGWFVGSPTPGIPDPTEGIYFRINGAGNYFGVTRNGSVETASDTGIASGATFRNLEIRCSPVAIHFLIDGVLVATNDTNIPTVDMNTVVSALTNPAASITGALQYDRERITGLLTP